MLTPTPSTTSELTSELISITLPYIVRFETPQDLGVFKVTAYSPYESGEITFSGLPVDRGVVAVDPTVIPLCSILWVEGYGYAVALDTGGSIRGRHIDIYVKSLDEALNWGVKEKRVLLIGTPQNCYR